MDPGPVADPDPDLTPEPTPDSPFIFFDFKDAKNINFTFFSHNYELNFTLQALFFIQLNIFMRKRKDLEQDPDQHL
jgi:hypothetical protein